jgi:hypothetical protein
MDHLLAISFLRLNCSFFWALKILASNYIVNEIMFLNLYLLGLLAMDYLQVVVANYLEILG